MNRELSKALSLENEGELASKGEALGSNSQSAAAVPSNP